MQSGSIFKKFEKQIKVCIFMAADVIVTLIVSVLSLMLRFDISFSKIPPEYFAAMQRFLIPNIIIVIVIFWCFRLYNSVWSFAGENEIYRIVLASALVDVILVAGHVIIVAPLPRSYYLIYPVLLCIFTIVVRFAYRWLRRLKTHCVNTMIIGAGDAGKALISEIIVAMPSASRQTVGEILDICKQTGAKLKTLPGMYQLINEEVSIAKLRDVEIEDLLGRESVKVDLDRIMGYIKGKVVVVTAGADRSAASSAGRSLLTACASSLSWISMRITHMISSRN